MKREIAVGLAALTLGFGAQATLPKDTAIENLAQKQRDYKSQGGKFKYEKGKDYEVYEYVTPQGEDGYQIIYEDETGIYSYGYGPEATERSFIIPTVASSTP